MARSGFTSTSKPLIPFFFCVHFVGPYWARQLWIKFFLKGIYCFFDTEKAKPNPLMYRVKYVKYLLDKLAKLKLI